MTIKTSTILPSEISNIISDGLTGPGQGKARHGTSLDDSQRQQGLFRTLFA